MDNISATSDEYNAKTKTNILTTCSQSKELKCSYDYIELDESQKFKLVQRVLTQSDEKMLL